MQCVHFSFFTSEYPGKQHKDTFFVLFMLRSIHVSWVSLITVTSHVSTMRCTELGIWALVCMIRSCWTAVSARWYSRSRNVMVRSIANLALSGFAVTDEPVPPILTAS